MISPIRVRTDKFSSIRYLGTFMLIAHWPPDKQSHWRINSGSASAASRLQAFPPSCRIACLLLAVAGLFPTPAWGGLSASDVVVVVNANSLNSRTLANHFVALRQIPAINVVALEGVPSSEVITVDDFRKKILKPHLRHAPPAPGSGHRPAPPPPPAGSGSRHRPSPRWSAHRR